MTNTKIISLLQELKPEELKELTAYIKVMCRDRQDRVLNLYNHLLKQYPAFDNPKYLDTQKVYRKIFPKKELAAISKPSANQKEEMLAFVREAASKLTGHLDAFKKQQLLRSDSKLDTFLKLRWLEETGASTVFLQELKSALALLQVKNEHSFDRYFELYVRDLELQHLVPNEEKLPKLLELTEVLDKNDKQNNLRYKLMVLSKLGNEIPANYNDMHSEVLDLAKELSDSTDLATKTFAQTAPILLADSASIKSLQNSLEHFKNIYPQIAKADAIDIFDMLLNKLTFLANSGVDDLEEILLNYNLFGIESGLLLDQDVLPQPYFLKVIFLASNLGRFTWATTFIDRHMHLLPDEVQKTTAFLAKARMYYKQENYDKALAYALQEEFTLFEDFIISSSIVAACYLELGSFDLLEHFLVKSSAAIKGYKKVDGQKKKMYLHFIEMVGHLQAYKKDNTGTKESLVQHFERLQPMLNNKWISAKIDAL